MPKVVPYSPDSRNGIWSPNLESLDHHRHTLNPSRTIRREVGSEFAPGANLKSIARSDSSFRYRQQLQGGNNCYIQSCLSATAPVMQQNIGRASTGIGDTMASFVILLIARTARIACSDRHTYRQTDTRTHTRQLL